MTVGNIIALIAVALSVALWLFNPDPIRRRLGLVKPPKPEELEPHALSGIQIQEFRRDPMIREKIIAAEKEDAQFAVPLTHDVPRKLIEGFEYFLTPDGRRCRYVGPARTGEVFFLLVKQRRA